MKKNLTLKEAAKYSGVCVQRINQKLERGRYPNARWCECGRSRLIPLADLKADKEKMKK